MSEILRFKLHKNYRNPVSIEGGESIFNGRNDEIRKLKNIINNRPSATVIIGGVRGVGKTSFVKECLRQVKNEKKDDLVVAEISFADFTEVNDPALLREKVLRSLIRALYFAFDEKQRDEDLVSLYDKTYYSELKETKLIELVKAKETKSTTTQKTEKTIKLTTTNEVVKLGKLLCASMVSSSGLWAVLKYLDGWWIIAGLLFLIGAVAAIFKMDISFSKTDTKEEGLLEGTSTKAGASGIATFDLSADTLEIKLRHVLEKVGKDKKVVFIIDELDKLHDAGSSLIEHTVYKIIKPLKNLFTLSNSIFVFIGADDFFDLLEIDRSMNPYSTSHTLFSDRMFLNSMYYEDINNLIDRYKDGDCTVGDGSLYKMFKAYIGWQAKNHVFDTQNLLDSFVEINEDNEEYVSIKIDDHTSKGNLADDWEIAAALQAFVAATFDNRKYPGLNRLNEKLYLTLREVAQQLYERYEVNISKDKYMDLLSDTLKQKIRIDDLAREDRDNFEGAIEDLLLRMERIGFAEISEDQDVDDDEKAVTKTTFELSDTTFPDETSIRDANKAIEAEEEFLVAFSSLEKQKEELKSAQMETFSPHLKTFLQLQKIAGAIKREERNREPKSRVLNLIKQIETIKEELRQEVFKEIVSEVSMELGVTKISISKNTLGQALWVADPKNSTFYNNLYQNINEDSYSILESSDKYVLVTLDFDADDQKMYLDGAGHQKRKLAKTKVTNIIFEDSITTKARQMKWSDVKAASDYSDVLAVKKQLKEQVKKYLL